MIKFFKIFFLFVFLFVWSREVYAKNWYLNDGFSTGDVYCTAIGTVGGTGLTPNSPKLFNSANSGTLKSIVASASAGDVVFIDVMDVTMATSSSGIAFDKAITIIGAGATKTILRGNSSAASPALFGVITSSNVVFKNFYCTDWAKNTSGNASCIEIVANSSDLSEIIFDGFWMDKNVGSGADGAFKIYGSHKISAIIKNMLSTCNNDASYGGGFWIQGNGHRITFSNCSLNNNLRYSGNGGAINIIGIGSSDAVTTIVTVDKCKFQDNNATLGYGGAISVAGAKLIVTNSCFSSNSIGNSSNYGSAIAGLESSRINLTNCTFSSNNGGKGGHVSVKYISSSYVAGTNVGPYELIIDKCSFDNTTSDTKCVYFAQSGTFSITNSTFTAAGTNQINASSSSWSLTNSVRSTGINPTYNIAPTTLNLLAASDLPSPTCNGSVSGSCTSTRTIDCTSDNLPPVIKGHDSAYVTNATCTFTVPSFTAIDLCDLSPTVTSVPAAGTALSSGTTTPVVITATDATGNSTSITVYLTTPTCTPCVTLTSAAGTDNQSLCRNASLTNITYSTKSDITGISNSGVAGANSLPPGVSATYNAGVITINGTPTNANTYNYSIPLVGGTCNSQNVTGTITVIANTTPTFTQLGPYCKDAIPASLPMSSTNTPSITGTWNATISTATVGTQTYTFTPTSTAAPTCATTATMTITINDPTTPTFSQVGPYCSGASISALPTTSINSIAGSWSPAINNLATTLYTFTPTSTAAPTCATTATMTITINDPTTPTFSQVGPYCSGASISALPTTSTNSIVGSWSPAIDNSATTLYTFTPTSTAAPTCATTATMTITITPQPVQPAIACYETATFNTTTCSWDVTGSQPVQPAIACYETATFNTTTCSWDVTGSQPVQPAIACYETATFNTTTCSWDVTGTQPVQPAIACYETATFNTTTCSWDVTGTAITPIFTSISPKCSGENISLPTISANSILGSWTPAINNLITTTYLFTPDLGQCAISTTLKIDILENYKITLTSDLASDSQKVCLNTPINSIEYQLLGANSVSVKNLPNGVTANVVADKVIILGTPTEFGIFDFVVKPTGGCGNDSVIGQIIVDDLLKPSVSITSSDADNVICAGSSVTFTAHPINEGTSPTYQWKLNGIDVYGEITSTYTKTTLVNGDKISVSMISNSNCITALTSLSNSITITIGSNLSPTFNLKNEICEGENYSLPTVSNEGLSGVWSPAINLKETKTYTFTPSVLNCYTTKVITLVVNPLPVVNSTVLTNNVCNNSTTDIQLTSNTPNTSFSWKANPTNNVTGASDGNGLKIAQLLQLSGNISGDVDYIITPTANMCVGLPLKVTLTVYPVVQPSVSIEVTNMPMNATKDTITLCPDDNVVFKATSINAGLNPTYQWKVNNLTVGLNSTNYSSGKIKDKDKISVTLISNQVCANPTTVISNVINAVVRANPLKVTAGSTLTCNGSDGSITMKGDAKGDIVWKLGADQIGDSQNVVLQTNPNSPFSINKLKAGTYNVTFDNKICVYLYKATVFEPSSPLPPSALIASKIAPICSGDSIQLTVKFDEDPPSSYVWIKDNLDTLKQTSQSIWVKDNGIYGASIVISGCVSDILDTTIAFEVKPAKLSIFQLSQPSCFSQSGSVKLTNLPGGNWKINTSPSIGSVINGFGNSYDLLNLNPATTYSISVQNDLGCISDTIQVNVKPKVIPPSPPQLTNIEQPTCVLKTGSVLLTSLPKGNWTITSTPQTTTIKGNITSQLISNLKDNTTYTFVVTDSNGCTSTNSLPLKINTYYGKPSLPSIQSPQTFCAIDLPKVSNLNTSALVTPIWYKDKDTSSSDVYSVNDTLIQNGSYYVSQKVNGCESDRVLVTVKLNSGPKFQSISPIDYCASEYHTVGDLVKKINTTNSTLKIFDLSIGGNSLAISDTLLSKAYYYQADSAGCKSFARQKVTVNISDVTLPTLSTTALTICSGDNLTFAELSKELGVASGLLWYTKIAGGVASTLTDKIDFPPMSQTFYVAYRPNQTSVCESKERVKVTVNLILTPTDILMKDHFYEPCKNALETVANLPTDPYNSNTIAWFSNQNALNPLKSTDLLYSTNYYAAAYNTDPTTGKKCYSSVKDLVDVHLYEVAFIAHPENSICDKNTGVLTIVEKDINGYSPFSITVKDQYGNLVGNSLKTNNLKVGKYIIEVTDAKKCKHSVTEMVGCTVLNLPQIITPDGDGKNDTWIINYYEKYPNVQISIYNRWGSKVYTSEIPYMDSWDGRPSSDILTLGEGYLPTGTYFYVIDKGNGEAVESGYIELVK